MSEKILYLTTSFPNALQTGQHFLLDLIKYVSQRYDVVVVTHRCANSLPHEKLNNIEVYRHMILPFGDFGLNTGEGIFANIMRNKALLLLVPFYFLAQCITTLKTIKTNKIRVIHANWILPSGLVAVVVKLLTRANMKILLTMRGSDINSFNDPISTTLKKFILSHVDEATVVSEILKAKVEKLGYAKKVYVIPTGVYTDKFTPNSDKDYKQPRFIYVGSLIESKGVIELVEAIRLSKAQLPNIHLDMVGNGPLKSYIKQQIMDHSMASNISLRGVIPNDQMPDQYNNNDVFILPSHAEGFPVTLAEALSCGLYCITSDIPVFAQLETHADFIKTCKTGSAEALAKAMAEISRQPEFLQQSAKQAREYAIQHLSKETSNATFLDIFKLLLS